MVSGQSVASRHDPRTHRKFWAPGGLAAVCIILAAGMPAAVHATAPATNAVRDWNVIALKAIAAGKQAPSPAMRSIAMVQVAVYDAIEAIATASPLHPFTVGGASLYGVSTDASLDSATAAAARTVLLGVTPTQRNDIDAAYTSFLAQIPDSAAKGEGALVGFWAGQRVLAWRAHDGSDASVEYQQPVQPGIFQPIPPARAVSPQWATMQPILLASASQFRPGPPPALASAQYAADYNEIRSVGSADSKVRTADQTQMALFWLDDDSYTWNLVARLVATQRQTTLVQDARMFAELNVAMLDVQVAFFDAKYTYNFWRPQAAIRAGDLDGNPATAGDASWTSLRPAPSHPEYPAAHPSYGAAASTVLASIFGDTASISFTSRTAPGGAVRFYSSFAQIAQEEGASRVYLGVHFPNSVKVGLSLGRQVGAWTVTHFGTVIPSNSPS